MEENNQKVNFFKRVKIAIFKLEDYGLFLGERFSVAIKYFFLLICIVSLIIISLDAYDFSKMINRAFSYFENEIPNFSYENEKLDMPNIVEGYDEEFNFKLIIDTNSDLTNEQIVNYKNKIYDSGFGILALEEKLVYIGNNYETEYTYKYFINIIGTEITNKNDILEFFNENNLNVFVISFAITDFIITYLSNLTTIFLDILVVAIFGLMAARFSGMRFKTKPMISLAIYSMTLSIVLIAIYRIVHYFTGFVIEYFDIMYILVGYVYMIAAIMMVKYDLIKQQIELAKIMEVQKQVHKEIEEEKEDKKEQEKQEEKTKDEKKEEEPVNDLSDVEPDGSEI